MPAENNDYLCLVDGSSLLTTQFFGSLPKQILFAKTDEEKERYFNKILQTSDGFYTNAVYGFVKYLFKIIREQKPAYLAIAWDITRHTFRREMYADYKGNRGKTMAPLSDQFAICEELMDEFGIPQFMGTEFEADDFCGSVAARFENEIPVFIMTKDNDYLQLVNDKTKLWLMHSTVEKTDELYKKYNIDKSKVNAPDRCFVYDKALIRSEFGVDAENVNSLKGIMGDASDNIKGVPGVGPATASALIGYYHTVDNVYAAIKGKSKAELDKVKEEWKNELGIKRSPINFLLKESDTELVGEKSARLSEKLATIKRDIDLDGLNLSDLKISINRDAAARGLAALEFASLDVNKEIPLEYLTDDKNDRTGKLPFSMKKSESPEIMGEQGISLITNLRKKAEGLEVSETKEPTKSKRVFEPESLTDPGSVTEFFESIKKYTGTCISFSLTESLLTVVTDAREVQIVVSVFVNIPLLASQLATVIEKNPKTVFYTFNLKDELHIAYSDSEDIKWARNIADLSIVHYLLNPLVTEHGPGDIAKDFPELLSDGDYTNDAEAAYIVGDALMAKLKESGMASLFTQVEMPLVYTLFRMEQRGILFNAPEIRRYGEELSGLMQDYEAEIYKEAGEEFNINSPKQLGTILFDKLHLPYAKKTKTGYSTSADVLERIRYEDPIVDNVLKYRQVAKLKSTYTDGLESFMKADGRIHSTFNQTITATGRLSSTDPNLQNIPVRVEMGKKIRKAFVPAKGYVFVDADYSQIELRIMAHMSGDPELIEAYREAKDIHRITASKVFHVPFDDVTPEMRRNAKAVNFGIIYGISSFGLGENLGISRKDAEEFIGEYFKTFPRVKEYLDSLVAFARDKGYAETMFGRRRPVPEFESNNFNQRRFAERVAMNAPIQGTAADIMKIAMNRVNTRLEKEYPDSKLLLQIHDEVLVEAREEDKEAVGALISEEMTGAAKLQVPLVADVMYGYDWYAVH